MIVDSYAKADSFFLSQLMGQCHGQSYKARGQADYTSAVLLPCQVNCLGRPLFDAEQKEEKK